MARLLNFKGDYGLFGVGLGSTYQGANALFGVSAAVKEHPVNEDELDRIVLEGGFILLALKIVLMVLLVRNSCINKLYLSVYLILVILFVPIVFNIYNSIYLFLGLALLDRVYYITGAPYKNAKHES